MEESSRANESRVGNSHGAETRSAGRLPGEGDEVQLAAQLHAERRDRSRRRQQDVAVSGRDAFRAADRDVGLPVVRQTRDLLDPHGLAGVVRSDPGHLDGDSPAQEGLGVLLLAAESNGVVVGVHRGVLRLLGQLLVAGAIELHDEDSLHGISGLWGL